MFMIKFLHAADLHLDSAFRGLTPARAAERRQEQRQMLTDMAELGNRIGCDLWLLAGDLFDSDNAFPETLEALIRALGSFRGQVFIAPGNHDCLMPGSPYFSAKWPENVHIFTSDIISYVDLPALGCRVYGAGFRTQEAPALLQGFCVEDRELMNLMVLHGDTETPASPYDPISKEQIAASGLQYLALGHVHLRMPPRQAGSTCYAWPGCPMGRGFDELGQKGVYLGELTREGCALDFHPLPGRRYEILSVTAGDDPLAAILAALPSDTREHIYRILLTGPADPIDTRALYAALEDRFYELDIRDRTEPKADLWQGMGENTLRGQFLSLMREKLDQAPPENRETILQAVQLGLAAMEGREEAVL